MKGYQVIRKAGWDTHGLPVELEIEKKLGIDLLTIKKHPKISIAINNRTYKEPIKKIAKLLIKCPTGP